MGLPTAYAFGGGSIGGPNVWDFSSGTPQLSQAARFLGTAVLPAGALSRQEIRNRQDVQQILQSGLPYVEAPTQYVLQGDRYINPLTGQSMGTMAAEWAASETSSGEMKRRKENRDKGLSWTGRPRSGGGRQPDESEEKETKQTEPAPEGYVRNKYGYLEPKEWYTEDGRKMTEQEYRESKKRKKAPPETQSRPTDVPFSLFSSYSPLLQSPILEFPYL